MYNNDVVMVLVAIMVILNITYSKMLEGQLKVSFLQSYLESKIKKRKEHARSMM